MKKKTSQEIIKSSTAQYLTFISATGDDPATIKQYLIVQKEGNIEMKKNNKSKTLICQLFQDMTLKTKN